MNNTPVVKPAGGWPNTLFVLPAFIGICFVVSLIGGWVTSHSVNTWYAALEKPWFTPPVWVFPPVWTMLYALVALSGWLVWQKAGWSRAKVALILFGLQLLINVLWSVIFFGMNRIDLALGDILLLIAAISATTAAFWRIDRLAAVLMLPYLLWVGFAAFINLGILVLN